MRGHGINKIVNLIKSLIRNDVVYCLQCGRNLEKEMQHNPVASITGEIAGDEYTESYYFCSHCKMYTIEIFHERFSGNDTISLKGPVSETEGRKKIDLIKQCPDPWDKHCRCDAHRAYFGKWLD